MTLIFVRVVNEFCSKGFAVNFDMAIVILPNTGSTANHHHIHTHSFITSAIIITTVCTTNIRARVLLVHWEPLPPTVITLPTLLSAFGFPFIYCLQSLSLSLSPTLCIYLSISYTDSHILSLKVSFFHGLLTLLLFLFSFFYGSYSFSFLSFPFFSSHSFSFMRSFLVFSICPSFLLLLYFFLFYCSSYFFLSFLLLLGLSYTFFFFMTLLSHFLYFLLPLFSF